MIGVVNMRVSIMTRLGFVIILTLSILNSKAIAQDTSVEGKWGLGLSAGYLLPLGNLYDRFDGGPKIALKVSYLKDDVTYEAELYYSSFSSGKIEDLKFCWPYNKEYYPSPDGSSQMDFLGLLANFKFPTGLDWSGLSLYYSVGAGFTYYKHQIKNMVYPGQLTNEINMDFTYSPDVEKHTALHANIGVGLQYFVTPEIYFGLGCRYNIIASYLRPMEAWLLEKVSPIQLLDINLEFIYYF